MKKLLLLPVVLSISLLAANAVMAAGFKRVPGCAKDIGVGNYDFVWVIKCAVGGSGGNEIYHLNGGSFTKVSGAAVPIAVTSNGIPWVVSSDGGIFHYEIRK
ncbi:hypothetical protein [Nostoc sp.]|uniref:hypothetical protein n=1 Tax=Nostoc sp. TaxID=1180 RepID=UPI002FFCEEA4